MDAAQAQHALGALSPDLRAAAMSMLGPRNPKLVHGWDPRQVRDVIDAVSPDALLCEVAALSEVRPAWDDVELLLGGDPRVLLFSAPRRVRLALDLVIPAHRIGGEWNARVEAGGRLLTKARTLFAWQRRFDNWRTRPIPELSEMIAAHEHWKKAGFTDEQIKGTT